MAVLALTTAPRAEFVRASQHEAKNLAIEAFLIKFPVSRRASVYPTSTGRYSVVLL